jgi:hypothetical protein
MVSGAWKRRKPEADLCLVAKPGRELDALSSPVRQFSDDQNLYNNINLIPNFFGKFSLDLSKSSKNGEKINSRVL